MNSLHRVVMMGVAGLLTMAWAGCAEFGSDEQALAALSSDNRYIVHFHSGVAANTGRQSINLVGGKVLLELPAHGIAAATLTELQLADLQQDAQVALIEVDARRSLMAQTPPYGIAMVQADQVPAAPPNGDAGRVKVCIIDSGFSRGHLDLFNGMFVDGTNVNGTGNWFRDGLGHGTHVAGTIAALNNSIGVIGVGPDAISLHIVRVFDDQGNWTYSSNLIGALDVCLAANAKVVSMSLGGSGASNAEANAFADALANGVLSIAAAGNDGNTQRSYPASHPAVVSVAAIDDNMNLAGFSQRNSAVELAAPGVNVMSTMPPGTGRIAEVIVGVDSYPATGMAGSPDTSGSGPLVDCGLAMSTCPGGGGHICLIQRGTNTFADKVTQCQASGADGAIIYNNIPGSFSGTLGGTVTNIPSAGITDTDGAILVGRLGQTATITLGVSDYGSMSGTSMATPHVSRVAALVWSQNSTWTVDELRLALQLSALDLGAVGRDNSYGFGLVQARAALDLISDECPNDPNKTFPGACGCGVPDTDTDGDGTADCIDNCVNDADKTEPGICGCGVSDDDTDGDGTVDCQDACPNDADKIEAGVCGCGVSDGDSDQDGSIDCEDPCPFDPDDDADGDLVCGDVDNCPAVPNTDQADGNDNGIGSACDPTEMGGDEGGCGCSAAGNNTNFPRGPAALLFVMSLLLLLLRVPGYRSR